jgi:hypothetical protein
MRKRTMFLVAALVVAVATIGLQAASASGGKMRFAASLDGYAEVPLSLSVAGTGSFTAQVAPDEASISYTLSYTGLTGPASAAHIHFGEAWVAGGVSAFLCGGGGKPACPGDSGTVSGTIVAADVIGPVPQGIGAGELGELLAAMRAGATYVNVHTTAFPGGEIRGQIQ